MNFLKKLLAPFIINLILSELTADRIKKWVALGADEMIEAVGKGFDWLAAKVEGTDNHLDDKALEMARGIVTQMVVGLATTGQLLDAAEALAVKLVDLAELTDNDYDNQFAQGLLDAIRAARG